MKNKKSILDEIYNWHSAFETDQEFMIYMFQDKMKIIDKALDYLSNQLEMEFFEKGILMKASDIKNDAIEKAKKNP